MTNHQTLVDLNILPDNPSGHALINKLDYCRTQGGKACLNELLLLKDMSYAAIMARRANVRFISSHTAAWKMPVGENDIFYIKQYFNTGYAPIQRTGRIKLVWKALRQLLFNKAHYYFILSGVKVTLRVVQDIVLLCRAVYDPAMPSALKEKLQAVQDAAASLGIGEQAYERFQQGAPEISALFAADSALRTRHKATVFRVLDIYYELEMYYSLATAHNHMRLSFPHLQETVAEMYLEDLVHPLVNNCAPNTLRTAGKNTIVITGPNMSGKSTFMKSVGVAFVMAGLGMGVAAKAAVLPVMDILITCIDIKDDIEKGYSYFFSEVRQVRAIAEQIQTGKRVLVIADEMFKGTNVQDALDCTAMVLEGFMQHPRNFYFIATHFPEIAGRFQSAAGCLPVCFDGVLAQDEVKFNYRLQPGISTLRIGSLILKQQEVLTLLQPAAATA